MRATLIQVEEMKFEHEGKAHDFDRYVFEVRTPMSHQDWSIVIDFQNMDITGDAVRYGNWDDLTIQECLEVLATLEGHQITRDFSHMLTPANFPTLGSQSEPQEKAYEPREPKEEEIQLYDAEGEPIDEIEEGELVYTENGELYALDEFTLDNEKIGVKFVRKYMHPTEGWKAYEFTTNDFIMFEGYDNGGSLFRLEMGTNSRGEEYTSVNVAYSEDYSVMEEVTYAFDIDGLIQIMESTNDMNDEQFSFEEWLAEEEEGDEY